MKYKLSRDEIARVVVLDLCRKFGYTGSVDFKARWEVRLVRQEDDTPRLAEADDYITLEIDLAEKTRP